MITLEDAKTYLRIDWSEDDELIQSLLLTAKRLVADVGRLSSLDGDDTVRTAVLYALAYLYENRNTADMHRLTLNLRAMLFAQREGVI